MRLNHDDRFWTYGLTALLMGAAAALLYAWSPQPIFTDEITYRAFASRFFFDAGIRQPLYPFCESAPCLAVPWPFYPAALVLSLLNFITDMRLYRLLGVGFFMATLLLTAHAMRRFFTKENTARLLPLSLLLGAALFVGLTPMSLVMLRVEYMVLLVMAGCLWGMQRRGPRPLYVPLVVLMLLYSIAVYMHPRALFFAPALACAVIAFARLQRPAAIAGLMALAVISVVGAQMLPPLLLHCPENPIFADSLQHRTLNPTLIFTAPDVFMNEALSMKRDWLSFAKTLRFPDDSSAYRLFRPPQEMGSGIKTINFFVTISLALNIVAALLFFLRNISATAAAARNAGPGLFRALFSAETGGRPLVLALLQLGVIAQMLLSYPEFPFYDAGFWAAALALLNVASLIFMAHENGTGRFGKWAMALLGAVHGSALIASLVLMYGFHFWQNFTPDKDLFISFRDPVTEQTVANTLKLCGLEETSPRLAYDEATYPFVQSSPFAFSALWLTLAADKDDNARAFLLRHKASVIARCALASRLEMPGHPLTKAGSLCCINYGD